MRKIVAIALATAALINFSAPSFAACAGKSHSASADTTPQTPMPPKGKG